MTYRVFIKSDSDRQRAIRLIGKSPIGHVVEVRPHTRSDAQNRMLWQILTDVAKARPGGRAATPDVWKALFMQACGHQQLFEIGLDGRPFPTGFRSSKMTVSEMADLITFIQQWGDENGVTWSDERAAA